jgi:hypothetical protein
MEKKARGNKTVSSALARTTIAIEEQIATAPAEHAVVLDDAGTLLVNKVGERREVSFTSDEVTRMRGAAVFIHNHPGGTSFSLPDILLAKRLNIREMRVVTGQTLYVLRPPRDGWPALTLRDLLNAVQAADVEVEERRRAQIQGGRLSKTEANSRHWHEVWTQVAQQVGLHYRKRTR